MAASARQTLSWRTPAVLSGIVLLSQAFSLPAPVHDAATLSWAAGFHLELPFWHIVFTPFCSVADLLTAFGLKPTYVLIGYVVAGCLLLGIKRGSAAFAAFLAFVAWGVLLPRPMGRLVAADPDILLIDFHSHSQYSHDGRPSFTPDANRRWHQKQGYGASFITDHNRSEASQSAKAASRDDWEITGHRSLEGEEISLEKTHLVILGNQTRVDNRPFDSDRRKIPLFIAAMHKAGYPVIASLPEYWFYHWGAGVQDFVKWGIDGFEIINSAPKALDFPLHKRLEIVNLCRRQNLIITGISDSHGYGYATAVWNAMRLPGWKSLGPDDLEKAVVRHLKDKRFQAVQVLERAKFLPHNNQVELLWSPMGNCWVYWRSLQPFQAISWVGWIWLAAFCGYRYRVPRR